MTGYRPGIRGWWQFLRLQEVRAELSTRYDLDRAAAVRTLLRRLRPSARLRQSEIEREHWKRRAQLLEVLEYQPAAVERSERRALTRALVVLYGSVTLGGQAPRDSQP